MDPTRKDEAGPSAPEVDSDAPPAYTISEVNDERNPAFIPSTMGQKRVYTTYHVYTEQSYLRKVKVALVKHLDSEDAAYLFEFPDRGEQEGQMLMHAGNATSPGILGNAWFADDWGSSTLQLSDGRVANISVLKRASSNQTVRLFRLDIQNARPEQHPGTMFWEMGSRNYGGSGGLGNYDLVGEDRKAYAVVITTSHKSLKKIGRLHFLVEPNEALVEMAVGSLMSIWKKAERDVRSGRLGLSI